MFSRIQGAIWAAISALAFPFGCGSAGVTHKELSGPWPRSPSISSITGVRPATSTSLIFLCSGVNRYAPLISCNSGRIVTTSRTPSLLVIATNAPSQSRGSPQRHHSVTAGRLGGRGLLVRPPPGVDRHLSPHEQGGSVRAVHKAQFWVRHGTLQFGRVLPHLHTEIEAAGEDHA